MTNKLDSFAAAAVNFRSAFCRPRENVERIVSFVEQAVDQRPATRLVVFPECATTGLPGPTAQQPGSELPRRFREAAETVPGHTSERLEAAARRHGVFIATGFVEMEPRLEGVIYNSSVLIGPNGVIAVHRKVHTGGIFAPGDEISVFQTAIGKLGLSICYDLWFPEFLRLQVFQGCEVHINMTANQPIFGVGSTHFPVVRAAENAVYVVSANRVGDDRPEGGLQYMGGSSVVAPLGEVLGMAGQEDEEVVYGEIVLERIDQTRRFLPSLQSRRSDLYDVVSHQRTAADRSIETKSGVGSATPGPIDH